MIQKDYYKILGVSMDASEVDIKKAYRKLAMQYHPDIPENHNTEEKFKEVSEAASVLTNSEKRKKYDAGRAGAAIKNYSAQTNYAKTSQPGFTELFKTVSKVTQNRNNIFRLYCIRISSHNDIRRKRLSLESLKHNFNIE